MNIRFAVPNDAKALLGIYGPFVQNTPISFETAVPDEETFAGRIVSYTQKYPWLVAEKKGVIAGYAYAGKHREREAYQWSVESSVYLHPDFQGKGIAQQLYRELFSMLKFLGYVNVYAGITLPNEKSIKLHNAMGFQLVGIYEKIGFKNGKWHDVQWMSRRLNIPGQTPGKPASVESIGNWFEEK
jgi:L-amino acid N-acyltransferase YncA